jgi:uncharacterized protein YndB with AHSA1/START domain
MNSTEKIVITVQASINLPLALVWKYWTTPEDIVHWNNASDDWHTPWAENDLRPGGKFTYRMEAKDGSFGFDFWGIYDKVILYEQIESVLGDGRKLNLLFSSDEQGTRVAESFEAEETNPVELQRNGWQAILDNFKKYAEGQVKQV